MKIGVVGRISPALILALESSRGLGDVEEDKKKIAIIGGAPITHFESEDFRAQPMCPMWVLNKTGKTGSNKSDRKRNRKDRWR